MKAMEDKIKAVLAECERLAPNQYDSHLLENGITLRCGLREWRFGIGDSPDFCSVYKSLDPQHEFWHIAHSLLSLGVQSPAPDENGLLPTDDEIRFVASDESNHHDWMDLGFKNTYQQGFEDGAKWMRGNTRAKAPIAGKDQANKAIQACADLCEALVRAEKANSAKVIEAVYGLLRASVFDKSIPTKTSKEYNQARAKVDSALAAYKGKEAKEGGGNG